MIRAVTRCTLEINRLSSPYFERAICFVKPEYARTDRLDLHRAASQLIAAFDADVGEQALPEDELIVGIDYVESAPKCRRRVVRLLPLALSAAAGAVTAAGITLLILL